MATEARAPGITACIVCRNEADRLGECLDSIRWVDEVIVLDLESADGSGAVARAAGAIVLPHPAVPIVEEVRNVVAAAAGREWILVVDPDERVSPGLAEELRRASGRADIDAVVLPRLNVDFGQAATSHLQRYEPQLRMYRRSAVSWPSFPNALPDVPEDRTLHVSATDETVLVHDRNRTIPEAIDRVRRYAPAQAQAMIDAGEEFTAGRMLATLGEKMYRHLVVSRALRDGTPGLIRAGVLVAFHFYVWAAFWQLSGRGRDPRDDRLLRRIDDGLFAAHRVAKALSLPLRKIRGRR